MSFLLRLLTVLYPPEPYVDKCPYLTELTQTIIDNKPNWNRKAFTIIPCIGLDVIESINILYDTIKQLESDSNIEPLRFTTVKVIDYMTHDDTMIDLTQKVLDWIDAARYIIEFIPDNLLPHQEAVYDNLRFSIKHHAMCLLALVN